MRSVAGERSPASAIPRRWRACAPTENCADAFELADDRDDDESVVVVATTGAARDIAAAAMDDAREDDPSAVAIIFDGSPNYWEDDATLAGAIDAVLLFANAFRLLNAGNRLLLVGEHPKAAQCLLPKLGRASRWRRWSRSWCGASWSAALGR